MNGWARILARRGHQAAAAITTLLALPAHTCLDLAFGEAEPFHYESRTQP